MAGWRIGSVNINGTPMAVNKSTALTTDEQIEEIFGSGEPVLSIAVIKKILFKATIELYDIKAVDEADCGSATLHFRCDDACGIPGADWFSVDIPNALIIPRGINGSPALLSVEIVPLSDDGDTCPVTLGSAAGVLTPVGSVWMPLNGDVSNISVDYGYRYTYPENSGIYQKDAFLQGQVPTLNYDSRDKNEITQARLCSGVCAQLDAAYQERQDCGTLGQICNWSLNGLLSISEIRADTGSPGTAKISVRGTGGVGFVIT